jgi:predicted RNA methylase
MKHNVYRDAMGSYLDIERNRAFYKAISQVVGHGDLVLDCGAGTGILSIFAMREGAKSVVAIEKDKKVAELARTNIKNSGYENKITVVTGEAAAYKNNADVVIIEMIGTGLINEDQVKVVNALVSKGVIRSKTRVIPIMCSNFFELVHYDFEFYDVHLPMVIQAQNDSRRVDVLTNGFLYNNVVFDEKTDPKVHYEGKHIIRNKGYLNAIKLSTVTHLTYDILIGATQDTALPIYIPVHEMFVNVGDLISVNIDYTMGQGLDSLKINVF